MNLSANGFMQAALTMRAAETITTGTPVKLTDNFTVSACGANDAFDGIVLTSDGTYCCVQVRGCITLPCSGTLPAVGAAVLAADGNGGVQSAESGTNACILAADDVHGTVTCIL